MTPEEFAAYIASLDGPLQVACDTESEGTLTLTIQFAVRLGDRIVVQLYYSPAIPAPSELFEATRVPRIAERCALPVELRPVKPITAELSLAEVVVDLLDLRGAETHADVWRLGYFALATKIPVPLVIVAHHWPADFFRIFGSQFFTELLLPATPTSNPVRVSSTKSLSYRRGQGGHHAIHPPALGCIQYGTHIYTLETRTFDTALPFGNRSLNSHAHTFLGLAKSDLITKEEMARMTQTFHDRTDDAYEYAMLDAVLTLRVAERMQEEDRDMYRRLGFTPEEMPKLRSTQGSRLVETMRRTVAKTCAAGSVKLAGGRRGGVGRVSFTKVRTLMKKGAGDAVTVDSASHFGRQNAESHGGLLYSRSSCKFFHDAPGRMRDVDLTGCYNSIISTLKMYLGRPVVLEPGCRRMTLREAVSLVQRHSAGRDAWIVKVSGPITQWPNALIPSTLNALTSENFTSARKRRQAQASRRMTFDEIPPPSEDTGNTALFTGVVEGGIVAWATWQVIKTLPEAIRREYEDLRVDTILFYHNALVARSGPEFDQLVDRFTAEDAPWGSDLDPHGLGRTTHERCDDDFVSLEFDIGSLARRFAEFRNQAQLAGGPESGAALAWKQHANTMYGVSASRHLETNNVVAANVITATGRALAFAMQLSLNGIQVITDGCTYRSDQVPAGTLAECLAASPDYPIQRIEGGVPFVDPATIPQDDDGFTAWYRERVHSFFHGADTEFTELLAIHKLQHKQSGDTSRTTFDGMLCDGSGTYVKLLKEQGEWTRADFKARSFGPEAKASLFPWMLQTYSNDCYEGPPILPDSRTLISYKEAASLSWTALTKLEEGWTDAAAPPKVWFPVGLHASQVQSFKVIKPSAFLFCTPAQRKSVLKSLADFSEKHACGVELITIRRNQDGIPRGSIAHLARDLYEHIRSGQAALTSTFNLTRRSNELDAINHSFAVPLFARKEQLRREFIREIDFLQIPQHAPLTGLPVSKSHLVQMHRSVPTQNRT